MTRECRTPDGDWRYDPAFLAPAAADDLLQALPIFLAQSGHTPHFARQDRRFKQYENGNQQNDEGVAQNTPEGRQRIAHDLHHGEIKGS